MDSLLYLVLLILIYALCLGSSETDTFLRPFWRRALSTLRPLAEAMRLLKPCLFFLFLFEGWNVLFIACLFKIQTAKVMFF